MTLEKLPRWATGGSALITEPSEGQKDTGWPEGFRVPAQWWNWLARRTYDWAKVKRDVLLMNFPTVVQARTNLSELRVVELLPEDGSTPKNRVIIAGHNSDNIYTSRNARNWYDTSQGHTGTYLIASCYVPTYKRIILAGYSDGSDCDIYTSDDGLTWTERANPLNETIYSLGSNADGSVILAGTRGEVMRSTNGGVTWTNVYTLSNNNRVYSIKWLPRFSLFILVGNQDSGSDAIILTTPDGSTFTERTNSFYTSYFYDANDNGDYVLLTGSAGVSNPAVAYSTDLATWVPILGSDLGAVPIRSCEYSADFDLFIGTAAGDGDSDDTDRLIWSPDPINDDWSTIRLPLPSASISRKLKIAAGRIIVVADNGYVLSSSVWESD